MPIIWPRWSKLYSLMNKFLGIPDSKVPSKKFEDMLTVKV
jgi:hypothetical protein